MAVLPHEPYRFPDTTPVCDRVRTMEDLADEGAADPLVRAWVADGGHTPLARSGSGDRANATWLLHRVQRLAYRVDPEGDWVASPRYVLLAGTGDCKRLATLLCAAYRAVGIPCRITWVTQPGAPLNHVSVVAWIDGRWVWADPSVRGAELAEPPYVAARRIGVGDRSELRTG